MRWDPRLPRLKSTDFKSYLARASMQASVGQRAGGCGLRVVETEELLGFARSPRPSPIRAPGGSACQVAGVEIGLPPREEVIVGERLCRLPVVTGCKSELWKSEYTVHEYDPIPAHKPSLRSRKALQGRQRSRFCQGHGASGTPVLSVEFASDYA